MHTYVCEQKDIRTSCKTQNGKASLLAKIYIKYAHLQMFRGLKIKKPLKVAQSIQGDFNPSNYMKKKLNFPKYICSLNNRNYTNISIIANRC